MRVALLLCACISLISGVASAGEEATVRKGETLTSIAKREGVTVADLRRWNQLGKNDVLRAGDTIHIGSTKNKRLYTIRKGDTLTGVAKREGVKVSAILRANPRLKRNNVRAGQEIVIPSRTVGSEEPAREAPEEESADKPRTKRKNTKQRALECPGRIVQLRYHSNYQLRSKALGWATAQTASALKRGFDHVRSVHRYAPRVKVLDASARGGGQLGGHLSHQTGHDIDITYYQKRCPASGCPLETVSPSKLDVRRQWTLISYWLRKGDTQFVLVDYDLQKVLYEHAKKRGVSEKKLRAWFQYPRPRNQPAGMIQHWEAHRNHVHVRFKPSTCRNGCCGRIPTHKPPVQPQPEHAPPEPQAELPASAPEVTSEAAAQSE
jgi:LysM repeat protein